VTARWAAYTNRKAARGGLKVEVCGSGEMGTGFVMDLCYCFLIQIKVGTCVKF